ncbi:MAG: nodulation protein NfeD [Olivibacter sp.]|nr:MULTISPECIES: NfeD family protein [Olivibacter]MCL4642209.1 nodulation protein NfeD [Olivibacter sp. UJ_SKK_5.1]MDM8173487.1 NfeD family protein [Olivibacter sp. 47]QEL04426.1 nodulation protein NfeD [Olivibacter sp. LS-1]
MLMIKDRSLRQWLSIGLLIALFLPGSAIGKTQETATVYQYYLSEEIGPAAWRKTEKAFSAAKAHHADYILIEINTYGGMLNYADSIRTKILESELKTIAFINHNAASAGALVALACDKIYMVKGASIGAASVVNPQGEVMPEKYQSYMRSLMRATAEAKGRDPRVAEAFVDPDVVLPELKEAGKVLTLTTQEALKIGMINGEVVSSTEILAKEGLKGASITRYQSTWVDSFINFLINPAVSSVLILLIIGGIYFEMQTPGIGFALIVAIIAALLFFAPLYIQGLADNWEIALFIIGIILLLLEVFVIPGFGVAGILGIIALVCGLAFSMVPNQNFNFQPVEPNQVMTSFVIVIAATIASIILCVIFGKSILRSSAFQRLVLADEQQSGKGYVSSVRNLNLINKEGVAKTALRPSGKIEIEGKWYDAVALDGFIDKDTIVYVEKHENYNLFVRKKKDDQVY